MIKQLFALLAMLSLQISGAQAQTSVANPAAVYCMELGGVYVIRKSTYGQTGFCQMPDGVERDAWQVFREQQPKNAGLANPAATFCVDSDGSYDTDSGNCTLPDGRVVNGWDFFRAHHAGQ